MSPGRLPQTLKVQTGSHGCGHLWRTLPAWSAMRYWGNSIVSVSFLNTREKISEIKWENKIFHRDVLSLKAGIYWVNLMDTFCAGWILLVTGILEVIGISWFYGEYKNSNMLCYLTECAILHWSV